MHASGHTQLWKGIRLRDNRVKRLPSTPDGDANDEHVERRRTHPRAQDSRNDGALGLSTRAQDAGIASEKLPRSPRM
eukprot:scaffold140238_cov33-Tisochrysis_lutea.AAC.3